MGSVEEGEDRFGDTGSVPCKMASGNGMKRAQRRKESPKKGRGQGQGAWKERVQTRNCGEKVGISTSFGGAQQEKPNSPCPEGNHFCARARSECRGKMPLQVQH